MFQSRQERQQLLAGELSPQHYRAPEVDRVDTKDALCQIDAER
jgi:hypothetical protein